MGENVTFVTRKSKRVISPLQQRLFFCARQDLVESSTLPGVVGLSRSGVGRDGVGAGTLGSGRSLTFSGNLLVQGVET